MEPRGRAREHGYAVGAFPPGRHNALTDVPGVRVGHTTVRRVPDVHSGVTAIVPEGVSPRAPLPAGVFAGNGYGKLIGTTQVAELGVIETPVLLTSTLSAFRAADALVTWMLDTDGGSEARSLNPVVGECNDGWLSDIRSRPVRAGHVLAALDGARGGPVAEGCVGGGTGLGALGFKSGIGTSSRVVTPGGDAAADAVTVGVLAQTNFGGTLRLLGSTVTPESVGVPPQPVAAPGPPGPSADREAGSCMLVVATDAPLDARQLTRLARRAVFGLARTGASYGHGSGDYGLAFSVTRPQERRPLPDEELNPLFEALLDTVEESVLNSLFAATTTTGIHGRTLHALPPARLPAPVPRDRA